MRIKVVSDLHLEFSLINIKNTQNYDVLILSGDIVLGEYIDTFKQFFDQVSSEFPLVIYVMGNHEFYRGDWNNTIVTIREFISQYPNIRFLENESFVYNNVGFIGCTLWTNITSDFERQEIDARMNDYHLVRDEACLINPSYSIKRHKDSVHYIENTLEDFTIQGIEKIVVVTHHAPSSQSIPVGFKNNEVDSAYYTNLEYLMTAYSNIALWTHGHVHHAHDYKIDSTRVVCNPRGYHAESKHEQTFFNENILIEI